MKAKKNNIGICIFFFLFVFQLNAQFINKDFVAKVEIANFEETIAVTGTVENLTNVYENLSYKLSVIKSDNSNNSSNNSQEGRFTIKPNEKKTLSKTQVNISNDDKTIILLLIYNEENVLVGKDRVVIGELVKEKNINYDGVEIAGLISDETKTKIGKDFYELYYKKYNEYSINGSEIVTIEEELNFGRTTKIKIYISNVLISEFVTFPDEEYLEFKAEHAVVKTKKHFKNVKENKGLVIQY